MVLGMSEKKRIPLRQRLSNPDWQGILLPNPPKQPDRYLQDNPLFSAWNLSLADYFQAVRLVTGLRLEDPCLAAFWPNGLDVSADWNLIEFVANAYRLLHGTPSGPVSEEEPQPVPNVDDLCDAIREEVQDEWHDKFGVWDDDLVEEHMEEDFAARLLHFIHDRKHPQPNPTGTRADEFSFYQGLCHLLLLPFAEMNRRDTRNKRPARKRR